MDQVAYRSELCVENGEMISIKIAIIEIIQYRAQNCLVYKLRSNHMQNLVMWFIISILSIGISKFIYQEQSSEVGVEDEQDPSKDLHQYTKTNYVLGLNHNAHKQNIN